MASDYHLKIGDIKGESQDATHVDEIDIVSFSWGEHNKITPPPPSVGAPARIVLHDIFIEKRSDKASLGLMSAHANGAKFDTAVITMTKVGTDAKPIDYIKITLTDVIVSRWSMTTATSEDTIPSESLVLSFKKVTFEYRQQKDDGGALPWGSASWDLTAVNKKSP